MYRDSVLLPASAAAGPAPLSDARRRFLPALVACALFMENLDVTIIGTSLPAMGRDLGCDPISLKLAITSYLITLAVLLPISGWMADRYGARRVFSAAILVFTLGSLACALAPSLAALALARALQGSGGAMMVPVARLVLMRAFAADELVRATTWATVPALIGPALGPLLGGLITTHFSWRWIFLVNVPMGLVGFVFARRLVPDGVEAPRPLDRLGFLLFGAATAGLSFSLEAIGETFVPPVAHLGIFVLAAILAAFYAAQARRAPAPLLDWSLLRLRTFRVAIIGNTVGRLGIGGMPFVLPLFFQLRLGASPLESGALTAPLAVAMLLTKFAIGPILRRCSFRRVLVGNTLGVALAMGGFAAIAEGGPPIWALLGSSGPPAWLLVAAVCAYGVLASIQFSCMQVLTYVDVPRARMSHATGIAGTIQQVSMSLGVAVAALGLLAFGQRAAGAAAFAPTFVCLALATSLSSLVFVGLRPSDGNAARHARCSAAR